MIVNIFCFNVRLQKIRDLIERHIIVKIDYLQAQCRNNTETAMLFPDFLIFPYVSPPTTKDTNGDFVLPL